MRSNWKLTLLGALILALGAVWLLAGCEADDPVSPTLPPDDSLPTTADEVVEDFQLAWDQSDSTALARALADGFTLTLDPAYVASAGLPNDLMSSGETLRAASWIFSGQSVFYDGSPLPGVTDVSFVTLARQEEWAAVAARVLPEDPPDNPTMVKASHTAELLVQRQGGFDLTVAGEMDLYATWRDSAGSDFYELARLEDFTEPTGKDTEEKAFGELLVEYLVNQAPVAIIAVADSAQSVGETFVLNAADSFDHDGPLHDQPYRWHLDPDGDWSAWTADPDTTVTYDEAGTKSVSLEVRDRWGVTDQAHQTLTVAEPPLPFPDSADKMVANFVYSYTELDIDSYRSVLHPDFKFILAVPDGGDTYYNYATDTAIAENMFSGEQGPGDDARPISSIQMTEYPQGIWGDVPQDDPNFGGHGAVKKIYEVAIWITRPGYNTFQIQGQVDFYAVRRDSLQDDQVRDYWELLGQVDYTGGYGKATEQANWGEVKAFYR